MPNAYNIKIWLSPSGNHACGGQIHAIFHAVRAPEDKHGVEEHEDVSNGHLGEVVQDAPDHGVAKAEIGGGIENISVHTYNVIVQWVTQ